MPSDASKHPPEDQAYLDNVSNRQLMDFRDYLFSSTFIALNAAKFLDHEWVDIALLKEYLQQTGPEHASATRSSTRSSTVPDPVCVKIEAIPSSVPTESAVCVKTEPRVPSLPESSVDIKMRTLNENGREVFQLLSDSETDSDDRDSDLEVIDVLRPPSRSSSGIPQSEVFDQNSDLEEPDADRKTTSVFDVQLITSLDDARSSPVDETSFDDAAPNTNLPESDTVWHDDGIVLMHVGKFRLTLKTTVERMEYREGPASIYPISRVRTGIVVDLSDRKYWLRDPKSNKLHSLNTVINNADNDSWVWSSSMLDGPKVTFAPGEKSIACQRIRFKCKGAHACDQMDPSLRNVVRFELDPAPRNAIIAAQQETRRTEGNTPEGRVVIFLKIIRDAKCNAVDSKGNKCRGGPILKAKPSVYLFHWNVTGSPILRCVQRADSEIQRGPPNTQHSRQRRRESAREWPCWTASS
ncbi:hypothetical protein B0H12DRAFT_1077400 [Mycena haematopus]|nr:hypothetical protein B0H12DRAFT_1077400 [Mycena haematopus]